MLQEMIGKLVEEFDGKQNSLIDAIGGGFRKILAGIKKHKSMHGSPPFIVDDGELALLLVDQDGSYVKLPPTFTITKEIAENAPTAIYSLPVPGLGLVRFIPVPKGFEPPVPYESNFVTSAYSQQFIDGLGQYLAAMTKFIPELTAVRMAKRLIQLQTGMEEGAKNAEIDLEAFMQLREVRDAFLSVLGECVIEGARRASEAVLEGRAEQGQ